MSLVFGLARREDAGSIATLERAVAGDLTRAFGMGRWSIASTTRQVRRDIDGALVLAARDGESIIGALRLLSKRPWAIDASYFTPARFAMYLVNMNIIPSWQRRGVGRAMLDEAIRLAREASADAIRLDAYDALAGAGPFYAKCGWREVGRVTYRRTSRVYYERRLGGAG